MSFLLYIFHPNPGEASYSSTSVLVALSVSAALIVVSVLLRMWRTKKATPMQRKFTRSWPSAALWFGIVGAVLAIARVETIQFVAMRFLWVLWALAICGYAFVQFRLFKARYYEVMPKVSVIDPREKYLPKKRR